MPKQNAVDHDGRLHLVVLAKELDKLLGCPVGEALKDDFGLSDSL